MASMQPKVRKPIAKQSAKAKEKSKVDAETFNLDKMMYAEIWAASPHVCQCGCKTKLGKEPLTTFFHHVLPKAIYPQFRHMPENIMILAPDCHNAVETSLDSRPVVKKRRQELIKTLLS
jgi:5-methylcytosine-specific restriction endonuclease McrA